MEPPTIPYETSFPDTLIVEALPMCAFIIETPIRENVHDGSPPAINFMYGGPHPPVQHDSPKLDIYIYIYIFYIYYIYIIRLHVVSVLNQLHNCY
jgi:hypothetical protein